MNNRPLVQCVERSEHRESGRQRFREIDRPLLEARRQRLPLQELHDDVELPVGLADLVQLAYMRMADRGRCPRLAPETLPTGRIGAGVEDHLDSDVAVEALIMGGIDDTHAALSELADNTVVVNPLALARHDPILWCFHERRTTARTTRPTVSPCTTIEKMTTA